MWLRSHLSNTQLFWSPSCVSSAKSSHPKKTGGTTKNTSSTTLHPRGAKDPADAVANNRKDARTNRKSDPPASAAPQKTAEPLGQPAALRSSPRLADGISTSMKDKEAPQGASGPQSSSKASAASEETHNGGAPEAQRGAPDTGNAAEDTSCTGGGLDCSPRGERPQRPRGQEGEDQTRSAEKVSSDESSLR